MFKTAWTITFATLIAVSSPQLATAQTLSGQTGSGSGTGWQASWLDLKPPLSFKNGETLRIKLEGTAENFMLRLLPATSQPSSSDGLEGQVRKVPVSGTVDVKLERDHPTVKQISVHAGPEAWEKPLGPNNGNVKLISVERIAK
jgi:hypothetical protein